MWLYQGLLEKSSQQSSGLNLSLSAFTFQIQIISSAIKAPKRHQLLPATWTKCNIHLFPIAGGNLAHAAQSSTFGDKTPPSSAEVCSSGKPSPCSLTVSLSSNKHFKPRSLFPRLTLSSPSKKHSEVSGHQLENADLGKLLKEFKDVISRGGKRQTHRNPIPFRQCKKFQWAVAPEVDKGKS